MAKEFPDFGIGFPGTPGAWIGGIAEQRIEPMTRSAVTLLFQSNVPGTLFVMAHPDRSLQSRLSMADG
jgi:hypothetical protein